MECILRIPIDFEDKYIGRSKFYFETFENKECGEIKTKKEYVDFINSKYIDGECIKD